jgi:serine/threonine protein kinase
MLGSSQSRAEVRIKCALWRGVMNQRGNGMITIPLEKLPQEVLDLLNAMNSGHLSYRDGENQTGVHHNTIKKIQSGEPIRRTGWDSILGRFGYSVDDILRSDRFDTPQKHPYRIGTEWRVEETLSPVKTASNGLQYRLFRLQHEHMPERYGRGKRYDLTHLTATIRKEWQPRLQRHVEVCLKIRHDRLPVHLNYFPATAHHDVWWVVDEWIPGFSLTEIMSKEDPNAKCPPSHIADIAAQILNGLRVVHAAGIVLRNLSPDTIWWGERGVTLTEFEMAKLAEGAPTVSKSWPFDPYLAPELGEQPATVCADVYSWSRVVTKLVLNDHPQIKELRPALLKHNTPLPVARLLEQCQKARPSERPSSIAELLPTISDWMKGASS